MAKKSTKELNTSCRATFKDGHLEEFTSIEEASESTGVSVVAIKIRCNKPGATGKDKITFEWLDDYTKRYYRAKKSKTKGADFELEIVHKLQELGYSGCCRAAAESTNLDSKKVDIADTLGELPVNIQCKNTQNLPSYFKIKEACPDDTKPFCLAWKKAAEGGVGSPGTVMIIPIDYFYTLLKCYKEHGN